MLFLLVMCIWGDLQVLKIWDYGSTLKSRKVKPSQAKPGQQHGKPTRVYLVSVAKGGCWISLLLVRGQDGLICSSAFTP